MPGMYFENDFDLTSFARGAVEKSDLLPRKKDITKNDAVIALLSSNLNLHATKIVKHLMDRLNLTYKSPAPFDSNLTMEDVLLAQQNIYVQSVLPLIHRGLIKAAYYTHDGMKGAQDILPEGHKLDLDHSQWKLPPIFDWIAKHSKLTQTELLKDYNCGIDMFLVVDRSAVDSVLKHIKQCGQEAAIVGHVGLCEEGKFIFFWLFCTNNPNFFKSII